MNVEPVQANNAGAPAAHETPAAEESLSAMMDNELGADGVDAALARCRADVDWCASWSAYQVVGDVLRGSPDVLPGQAPSAFLQAVRARLEATALASSPAREPAQAAPGMVTPVTPSAHGARAAHEGAVPEPADAGVRVVRTVRGEAANAPVLRWKLVSGVASLVAVMAVGWGMLQQGTPGAMDAGAPQLAQSAPATPASPAATDGGAVTLATSAAGGDAVNPAAAGVPVVVTTGQGQLIRDARLEQLLAEHRQYGGMSALQMPAGFLRNATYDAAPGR